MQIETNVIRKRELCVCVFLILKMWTYKVHLALKIPENWYKIKKNYDCPRFSRSFILIKSS